MRVDKVGKEEVQLTHGYVDVVGVDAQVGMQTIRRLLQPLTVCRFQRNGFEEDHLDQIQSPDLVSVKHLSLLLTHRYVIGLQLLMRT